MAAQRACAPLRVALAISQPLGGFMVGDEGEVEAMDERAKELACPNSTAPEDLC